MPKSHSEDTDKPHFLKKHQAIVIPVGVVLGVALGFGAGFLLYRNNNTFKDNTDKAIGRFTTAMHSLKEKVKNLRNSDKPEDIQSATIIESAISDSGFMMREGDNTDPFASG
jgi:predicted 2-oxoglutarate/Fe(II)-dependent dioxygenase YbiX